MCSIFSKYLTPIGVDDENQKPSVIYDHLRIAYNQGVKGIVENTKVFSLCDDEVDDEILYEIWRNDDLHSILVWVNKKIVLLLGLADYRTIGVRMRIATGLLNKLVYDGRLSAKLSSKIHRNFVTTINGELSEINTEDLPF
jgi:hypothetical protein